MSTRPPLITAVAELRQAVAAARRSGLRIGLVPTMGALHQGHLSLVEASRSECGLTVVSIYVNPTQFGPQEDFSRYPRTLDADLDLLCGRGETVVFAPTDGEMYPEGFATWVEVASITRPLEGEYRPGHFRGVTTVVMKLLNMVGPDAAYFGQKDYQQAAVIRRMVGDLNVPVTVRICPTVREADGLALSSRNRYLAPPARRDALVLWHSLRQADELIRRGERTTEIILERMREIILTAQEPVIDYIALVDPQTLQAVEKIDGPILAALAVRIGGTRLIDNQLLNGPEITAEGDHAANPVLHPD
jgi:pantoate--beta-alanine ligase